MSTPPAMMTGVGDSEAIALAITGASGGQYAMRLLECLIGAERQVYLMISLGTWCCAWSWVWRSRSGRRRRKSF